jgi:prepilin-type N-terminal cleavage/methylation domain-containing protein
MHSFRFVRQVGFTLIELLIVISIIGLLAAALLPNILSSGHAANTLADQANLQFVRGWLLDYKRRVGNLPMESGHKFLLDLWVKKVCSHSEESFDRFFAPGAREEDPHYVALRKRVQSGDDPWPSLERVSSIDTHYAGRTASGARAGGEADRAWAADDNENGWTLADGTINILYEGGHIRSLSIQQLAERFQWAGLELVFPVGGGSPHPDLKQLEK